MEESYEITIPNFTLGKEIGRGGMARVYLGEQLEPKRKVAIKIVTPQGNDPKILEDLQKEGDTVAQFSHPNIVTVFSCGVIESNYYLAMEILGGGDLAQKIEAGITELEAFNIMIDMAKALEHSHKRGTLHRDIKPENILFHEDGQAVLVDFGIAKAQNSVSEFTRVGAVVGTPHYMSPERALGKEIDERSDLYALGVVLYEMLMGKKVFEGGDTFAISYAHVHEPVPDLPEDKAKYQSLLNKLLAKNPDDRFQTSTQLISQLKKYVRRLKPVTDTTHSFAPLQDMTAAKKKTSPMPFIITGLVIVVAVLLGTWFMNQQNAIEINQTTLNSEQLLEMSNKLGAAEVFFKQQNINQAEALYLSVLTEFDCKNEDARNRIKILNRAKYDQIIAACD
ncbi:serine/threonine-protein kinase [Marinicella litoralis]|uniref:non-specific serine/threonine protein kinase n=1 Tax=Marinicella litoralis TaxID=644220 RepID=A0A4V3DIJ6_9GAMM|nr:serine/threonine-protein kinase [Marinicella litoralis]TDR22371.1 serine/threonine protein kinase [Marinicella litoralis]